MKIYGHNGGNCKYIWVKEEASGEKQTNVAELWNNSERWGP